MRSFNNSSFSIRPTILVFDIKLYVVSILQKEIHRIILSTKPNHKSQIRYIHYVQLKQIHIVAYVLFFLEVLNVKELFARKREHFLTLSFFQVTRLHFYYSICF